MATRIKSKREFVGFLGGHEAEYGLYLVARGQSIINRGEALRNVKLPNAGACIHQILRLLYDRYQAVPFGYEASEAGQIFDPLTRLPSTFNDVLLPGLGRVYREANGPYLEMATWPCRDPYTLCELIMRSAALAGLLARDISTDAYRVHCFNAVSDRKGFRAASCGMHDNFLVARSFWRALFRKQNSGKKQKQNASSALPIERVSSFAQDLISWRVLRIILVGAGKVGVDWGRPSAHYQMSERADFLYALVNAQTMQFRPILNTRDEPHADAKRFARLHVINGEGNRSWWAQLFDVALTGLWIMALHEQAVRLPWYFADPIQSLMSISRDLTLSHELAIYTKSHRIEIAKKPLALLDEILGQLIRFSAASHLPSWCNDITHEAQCVSQHLAAGDPEGKAGQMLDWKIKHQYLAHRIKTILKLDPDEPTVWQNPRVKSADLAYHLLDDTRVWKNAAALSQARDADRTPDPDALTIADLLMQETPHDTNAYLFSFLMRDPILCKHVCFSDWSVIKLWETSPTNAITLRLPDPRLFTRKFLESEFARNPRASAASRCAQLLRLLVPYDAQYHHVFEQQQKLAEETNPRERFIL